MVYVGGPAYQGVGHGIHGSTETSLNTGLGTTHSLSQTTLQSGVVIQYLICGSIEYPNYSGFMEGVIGLGRRWGEAARKSRWPRSVGGCHKTTSSCQSQSRRCFIDGEFPSWDIRREMQHYLMPFSSPLSCALARQVDELLERTPPHLRKSHDDWTGNPLILP